MKNKSGSVKQEWTGGASGNRFFPEYSAQAAGTKKAPVKKSTKGKKKK